MKRVGKRGEEGSGTEQHLGVDAMKDVEVGDIADDPDLITVQKHDISCLIVGEL